MTNELIDRLNHSLPCSNAFGLGDFINKTSQLIGMPIVIPGTWYYYCPFTGSDSPTVDGTDKTKPLKTFEAAYAKCVDGAGDGIVALSAGTGTSSQTTNYFKKAFTFAKSGITVIGAAAPVRMYGRARIANTEVTSTSTVMSQAANSIDRETGSFVTDGWIVGMKGTIVDSGSNNGATFTVTAVTALSLTVSETLNVQTKAQTVSCVLTSYIATMLTVSGSNNAFYNMHIGNFGSNVLSVGAVKVTGNRNFFAGCHLLGAGHATPAAAAGAYDLEVNAGQENTFERCTFGTDSIIRAATNGNIRFDGGAWRTRFVDCDIVSYSATSTKGAILSASASAFSGIQIFARCRFLNWNENGIDNIASAFIGTKPLSGNILMDACSLIGYTAWDSVAANDVVYVGNSAAVASGAGGIATTV